MNPLAIPALSIVGGLAGLGIVIVGAIGVVRKPDPVKYKEIWLKLGVHLGILGLGLLAAALSPWALLPFVLFMAGRAWFELLRGLQAKHEEVASPSVLIALGVATAGSGLLGASELLVRVFVATWVAIALPMLITRRPPALHGLFVAAFGMAFISMPLALILVLGSSHYGAFAFLFLILMANDGLSEGLGRLFGKTPIWPHISPNKTWGGTFGGLLSSMLIGLAIRFLVPDWSLAMVLLAAGGISLVAGVGDLVASSIKRELGIKDYGTVLPGHGGILDRFDSLLFTTPVFYWTVMGLGGLQ